MSNEFFYKTYNKKGSFQRTLPPQAIKTGLTTNEYIKGVSCIVLQDNKIIFEVRGGKQDAKGALDFCSGKVSNNEKLETAMIRELGEELGISKSIASNIKELNNYPVTLKSQPAIKNFHTTFYYLQIPKEYEVQVQQEEMEKIIKLPINEAYELIRKSNKFRSQYNKDIESTLTKLISHLQEDGIINKVQANNLILPQKNFSNEK